MNKKPYEIKLKFSMSISMTLSFLQLQYVDTRISSYIFWIIIYYQKFETYCSQGMTVWRHDQLRTQLTWSQVPGQICIQKLIFRRQKNRAFRPEERFKTLSSLFCDHYTIIIKGQKVRFMYMHFKQIMIWRKFWGVQHRRKHETHRQLKAWKSR